MYKKKEDFLKSCPFQEFQFPNDYEKMFDYVDDFFNVVGDKSVGSIVNGIKRNLLASLISYLVLYRPKHQRNFSSIAKLLRASDINAYDTSVNRSKLDRLFDEVAVKDPTSIAFVCYTNAKTCRYFAFCDAVSSLLSDISEFEVHERINRIKQTSLFWESLSAGEKVVYKKIEEKPYEKFLFFTEINDDKKKGKIVLYCNNKVYFIENNKVQDSLDLYCMGNLEMLNEIKSKMTALKFNGLDWKENDVILLCDYHIYDNLNKSYSSTLYKLIVENWRPRFARACPSKTETDNEEKEREDKLAEIELKMVLDELEQKENDEEDIGDEELINEELKKEKKGTSSNTEEINDKDAFDNLDFGDFS